MDMKPHVVIDMAVFAEAMMDFIDSQYKQMVYARNMYRIPESYKHYLKAKAGLHDLETALGTPIMMYDYIREIDLEKFSFGKSITGVAPA